MYKKFLNIKPERNLKDNPKLKVFICVIFQKSDLLIKGNIILQFKLEIKVHTLVNAFFGPLVLAQMRL